MTKRTRMTRRGFSPVAFFLITVIATSNQPVVPQVAAATGEGSSPRMLAFRGATMGTTYSVKISDPPIENDAAETS
ncbi:MAG: thiamine biosynthesis protein ApbE, partial [Rhodopirellula sp. JB044]